MAMPIRATPTLTGKYAEMLAESMIKTEKRKPNKTEIEFFHSIQKLKD
jgi:hypothetical protein